MECYACKRQVPCIPRGPQNERVSKGGESISAAKTNMIWTRAAVDAQESGQYRILRTDTNGIRRYLVFYGRTTPNKSPKVLGVFDDPFSAQECAEEHSKKAHDQVP